MRYVRLGKTDLEVSAIGFGTWAFGGDWGSFDAEESKEAIRHALDLGVTFFDTAQAYGFGVSERLLADSLWEHARRDEVIVATNWSRRYKTNLAKLSSGDIYQVAEVVRNLSIREKEKGLSAGEKHMLAKARQILVSELTFAFDSTEEKAEAMLDKVLEESH